MTAFSVGAITGALATFLALIPYLDWRKIRGN